MSQLSAKTIGIFLLTGSIVNDAFLLGEASFFTWAKLLFATGILLILFSGISTRKPSKAEYSVAIYVLLLLTITTLSNGPGLTSKSITVATSLTMGAITFTAFLRLQEKLPIIINSYVVWTCAGAILGFIQSATGKFFVAERIFPSGIIEGTYRASGLMSDPNYFALTCLLAIALGKAINLNKSIYLLLATGVIASGSRAGMLILFAYLLIGIVKLIPRKNKLPFGLAFISIAAILSPLITGQTPEYLSMVFNPESYTQDAERNSLQDRALAISAAISAFTEYPILGYGLGNLVLHPLNFHEQVSHNSYIEIAAETGIAGLLLYGTLWIHLYRIAKYKARRKTETQKNKQPSIAAIVTFLFFSAMSLTLVTYYSRIFFFVIAVAFMLIRKSSYESEPRVLSN